MTLHRVQTSEIREMRLGASFLESLLVCYRPLALRICRTRRGASWRNQNYALLLISITDSELRHATDVTTTLIRLTITLNFVDLRTVLRDK